MINKLKSLIVPVLVVALIVASFFIGKLWTKVQFLEEGVIGENAKVEQGTKPTGDPLQPRNADSVKKVDSEDHVIGDINARVVIIEYSDYECTFCSKVHPTLQAIVESNSDVAWVYRHFPLDQIHPEARPMAKASECIADLAGNDAFWSFTDNIFENGIPTDTQLTTIASGFGIEKAELDACTAEDDINARVDEDLQSGSAAGVQGTPGNILLNQEENQAIWIPGALPQAQFELAIKALLNL